MLVRSRRELLMGGLFIDWYVEILGSDIVNVDGDRLCGCTRRWSPPVWSATDPPGPWQL